MGYIAAGSQVGKMGDWVWVGLSGGFGASLQELLFWFERKASLSETETQRLLRSPGYWVIVILMIVASGVGVIIWFSGQHPHPKDCMLVGAAFPLIFKKAVQVVSGRPVLGSKRGSTFALYFTR